MTLSFVDADFRLNPRPNLMEKSALYACAGHEQILWCFKKAIYYLAYKRFSIEHSIHAEARIPFRLLPFVMIDSARDF